MSAYSSEDIAKGLKLMLTRLQILNEESETMPVKHICSTCKYRMTETHLRDDWGFEEVWHNWCQLDKNNMETKFSTGNGRHFNQECEFWEKKETCRL